MNEDVFPIGSVVNFQPDMLVYWRVKVKSRSENRANACPLQDIGRRSEISSVCFQVTRGERKAKPGQVFLNQPQHIKHTRTFNSL